MPDQDGQHDEAKTQEDLKAKMREALERKRSNDPGVTAAGHRRGKAPETHGPQGGVHMHRRKAGGGGS